jgi:hypothetical protein
LTAKLSAPSAPSAPALSHAQNKARLKQQQQQQQNAKPVHKRLAAFAFGNKPSAAGVSKQVSAPAATARLMHNDGAAGLLGSGFNLTWIILAVMLVAVIGVVISSHQHVSGLGYKLDVLMATLA